MEKNQPVAKPPPSKRPRPLIWWWITSCAVAWSWTNVWNPVWSEWVQRHAVWWRREARGKRFIYSPAYIADIWRGLIVTEISKPIIFWVDWEVADTLVWFVFFKLKALEMPSGVWETWTKVTNISVTFFLCLLLSLLLCLLPFTNYNSFRYSWMRKCALLRQTVWNLCLLFLSSLLPLKYKFYFSAWSLYQKSRSFLLRGERAKCRKRVLYFLCWRSVVLGGEFLRRGASTEKSLRRSSPVLSVWVSTRNSTKWRDHQEQRCVLDVLVSICWLSFWI